MTTIRCDRCGIEIDEGKQRQISVNTGEGDMDIVIEDACEKCVVEIRKACAPLPRAARHD